MYIWAWTLKNNHVYEKEVSIIIIIIKLSLSHNMYFIQVTSLQSFHK